MIAKGCYKLFCVFSNLAAEDGLPKRITLKENKLRRFEKFNNENPSSSTVLFGGASDFARRYQNLFHFNDIGMSGIIDKISFYMKKRRHLEFQFL